MHHSIIAAMVQIYTVTYNTIIILQIVSISFGSETKDDPVQDVLFYTTEDPFKASDWKSIQAELGVKVSIKRSVTAIALHT